MSKTKLKRSLVIGSANFMQKYGVEPAKIKHNEIKKILKIAKKNNIYKIDTAEAYLKNQYIFKEIDKKFKISTKVIPDHKWVSLEFCQKHLENHFENLNTNKVETIFFHDIKILFTKNGKKIFENFELLKKKKFFQKIGISIYDTNCLDYINSNYDFDVVQCPYNILDKRILTSGWYDELKNQGKEIHIRSIFLQGLLVNKSVYKKKYFKKWNFFFVDWFKFLKYQNISPIDYCLTDLLRHHFDRIVVGINDSENLKEIINFNTVNKNKIINFNIVAITLIDPRKWR